MKYNIITNRILRKAVCAALAATLALPAVAQNVITGTVRDQTAHTPLAGVNVLIPGTTTGTSTTAEGRYSIRIPEGARKQLVFSLIGYQTDTLAVNNRTILDVELAETSSQVEEVVVVGYGSMRKSDITGSSVSVKINDEDAASVSSFDKLLQGRAAGVSVTTGNSAPGGAVQVVIRGSSSFNSSNQPLYVVDGVILNSPTEDVRSIFNGAGGDNQETQNPLTAINARDILSMEVLKDASATAIYGSQGANGVVLITTKQGTTMKPKIDFSSTLTISHRNKKIPLLNTREFAAYRDEMKDRQFLPDTVRGVDWQDYSMRTAFSTSNRVTISGKTPSTNYLVAAGYSKNNGIVKQTANSASDLRVNLESTLSKIFTVGTRTSFSYITTNMLVGTDANGGMNNSMTRQILSTVPYWQVDLNNPDDDSGDELSVVGPYTWFKEYDDTSRDYHLISNAYLNVKIAPWLSFRSSFGADFRSKSRERYFGPRLNRSSGANGRGGMAELRSFKYTLDNMLNFNKSFRGGHRLSGVVGFTISSQQTENVSNSAENFTNSDYRLDGLHLGQIGYSEWYSLSKANIVSVLARVVYSYRDRYVVTGTFRTDGSSKFARENRYSYFPSIAFAWRVSEEGFLKGNRTLTYLKFRAGWGQVGNQGLAPYQTLATYGAVKIASPGTVGDVITGYAPSVLPNPSLKWETTQQINVGVDLGLFNRITITADIYKKDTKDLLQRMSLPYSSGFSTMWANRGSIRNNGLEISLDGTLISNKDFSWNIGGNISFNRNKITDSGCQTGIWGTHRWKAFLGTNLTNSNSVMKSPVNIFIEGKPSGLFYGFKTDGIIQEDGTGPTFNGLEKTSNAGYVRYVDQDGDNNITDADLTIIGNPNPDFTYGFYTSFSWKGLSLDLNFNGVYGNDILNANLVWEEYTNGQYNIRRDAYFKAWRPDAPNNEYPALKSSPDQGQPTDRMIEDGSFLRLANATLSYKFNLKKSSAIKAITASISGNNLFCISNYKGWDPEVNSFTFDPLRVGIDWSSFPNYRSYTVGIGLSF